VSDIQEQKNSSCRGDVLTFPVVVDCDLQEKLFRADFFVHPEGVFKSVEELWDGEI
jgi:hypothetical protein